MAIQTLYHTPSPSQWASAARHLDRAAEWRTYRVDGVRYIAVPSGCSGKVYAVRADAAGCSCDWYRKTWNQCSHMLAIYLMVTESELSAPQPRPAIGDIMPAECWERGCTKDVVKGEGACADHALCDAF